MRLVIAPASTGSDPAAVRGPAAGDEAAPEQVYRRWPPSVHGRALRQLRDDGEAQDVTQAVFVAVRRSRTWYRPASGTLGARISGIARHNIADA